MGLFGSSVAEWMLLALLAFFVLFVALMVRGGRVRAWITRAAEVTIGKRWNRAPRVKQGQGNPASAVRAPLAVGVIACLSVANLSVWLWFWIDPSSHCRTFESCAPAVLTTIRVSILIGLACFLIALVSHLTPAHNRKRKYEFLWIAAACLAYFISYRNGAGGSGALLALGALVIAPLLHFRPNHSRQNKWAIAIVGVLGMGIAWLEATSTVGLVVARIAMDPLVVLGVLLWASPHLGVQKAEFSDTGLLHRLRLARRLTLPVLLLAGAYPLNIIYLWFRYEVVNEGLSSPILYLRSFSYAGGPTAFGRIVAKEVHRYGVLSAIVHRTQPGSALLRFTSVANQAMTEVAPDDDWQPWVIDRFDSASAVVFDVTELTDGVAWELETALARPVAARTVVLIAEGAKVSLPPKVAHISYRLESAQSVSRARRRLKEWLLGTLVTNRSDVSTTVAASQTA